MRLGLSLALPETCEEAKRDFHPSPHGVPELARHDAGPEPREVLEEEEAVGGKVEVCRPPRVDEVD